MFQTYAATIDIPDDRVADNEFAEQVRELLSSSASHIKITSRPGAGKQNVVALVADELCLSIVQVIGAQTTLDLALRRIEEAEHDVVLLVDTDLVPKNEADLDVVAASEHPKVRSTVVLYTNW